MEKSQIIFTLPKEGYVATKDTLEQIPTDEIIKIDKEGFFYKGERVEDVYNIYERFNEWLTNARKVDNLD